MVSNACNVAAKKPFALGHRIETTKKRDLPTLVRY